MYSSVTRKTVAEWCAGEPLNGFVSNDRVSNISTDSRTVRPGDLFLALKGLNFDGNKFLSDAVRKGASATIGDVVPIANVPHLRVRDSVSALVEIGRGQRSFFKGKVIAITGSAGKSSTKEMIATLLGPDTVKSPASFNNLVGISKTLCLLSDASRNLVLEMGMNAAGEIATLCQKFRPDLGLITNIGDAHMGRLGGRDGVYRAKKELFEYLAAEGCSGVALNADDPNILRAADECFSGKKVRSIRYSVRSDSDERAVCAKSYGVDPDSAHLAYDISVCDRRFKGKIPIFGGHHVQNLVASIAMAILYGKSPDEIEERIQSIRPAAHRGEILELPNHKTLIDESYNSNPSALLSALESLMHITQKRRILLVLGEMRELGAFSADEHRRVGSFLAEKLSLRNSAAVVIGVGPAMSDLMAVVRGVPGIDLHCVESVEEATGALERVCLPNDVIFVKGSRGVALERVVQSVASQKT